MSVIRVIRLFQEDNSRDAIIPDVLQTADLVAETKSVLDEVDHCDAVICINHLNKSVMHYLIYFSKFNLQDFNPCTLQKIVSNLFRVDHDCVVTFEKEAEIPLRVDIFDFDKSIPYESQILETKLIEILSYTQNKV